VAEGWAVFFDRDKGNVVVKQTLRFQQSYFSMNGLSIQLGENWELSAQHAKGNVALGSSRLGWDLKLMATGEPFVHLPYKSLYCGSFPKSKLVSPSPNLVASGTLSVNDQLIRLDGWRGMQGHNWGTGHAPFYAWGHCNQWEEPVDLVVEVVSARVKIGPLLMPSATIVCVRWDGVDYQFNGPAGWFRNEGKLSGNRWRIVAVSGAARFDADISANRSEFVGLYYPNPDGTMTYCLNSKLANARVRVQAARKLVDVTSRACAYEIGTTDVDHGVRMYV
jgi:hypothetical protein